MIKKFIDEYDNIYVFVESEERLIMWLNGKCEYTFTEIVNIPQTLQEARKASTLNVWYPIEEI